MLFKWSESTIKMLLQNNIHGLYKFSQIFFINCKHGYDDSPNETQTEAIISKFKQRCSVNKLPTEGKIC